MYSSHEEETHFVPVVQRPNTKKHPFVWARRRNSFTASFPTNFICFPGRVDPDVAAVAGRPSSGCCVVRWTPELNKRFEIFRAKGQAGWGISSSRGSPLAGPGSPPEIAFRHPEGWERSICPPTRAAEGGCGYLGPHPAPSSSPVGWWGLLGFMECPRLLPPAHSSHPRVAEPKSSFAVGSGLRPAQNLTFLDAE